MYHDPAHSPEYQQLRRQLRRLGGLDPAQLQVGGRTLTPGEVVSLLAPFLSEGRLARIEEVLDARTYTVATVVEGLIDMGNVSAVMRSAEALGYQAFHLVAGDRKFKNSPRISQGAEKWLDVSLWEDRRACVEHLRREGYRIVVTHLDETSVPLSEVDFTQRTALVFGNERDGVSAEMLALSDKRCVVPMVGFTQSFNISVAAAVCLYHAYRDRLFRQGYHGDLTPEERDSLRAAFCLRSVRKVREVLREALLRKS